MIQLADACRAQWIELSFETLSARIENEMKSRNDHINHRWPNIKYWIDWHYLLSMATMSMCARIFVINWGFAAINWQTLFSFIVMSAHAI